MDIITVLLVCYVLIGASLIYLSYKAQDVIKDSDNATILRNCLKGSIISGSIMMAVGLGFVICRKNCVQNSVNKQLLTIMILSTMLGGGMVMLAYTLKKNLPSAENTDLKTLSDLLTMTCTGMGTLVLLYFLMNILTLTI